MLFRRGFGITLVAALAVLAMAQNGASKSSGDSKTGGKPTAAQETDPLKRTLTPEQKKQQKSLLKELEGPYKKWLSQDVVYIITDEEKGAFLRLSNNEERDQFIEQFWLRRDPTPDTVENEYKEEHYRRIAYANERYTEGAQGWRTDRGRIYIVYGKPNTVVTHATSESGYVRPLGYGRSDDSSHSLAQTTTTRPYEVWTYNHIDGVGENVNIEFVDTCSCGVYKISMDPLDKDMNAELVDPATMIQPWARDEYGKDKFERLQQFAKLSLPPPIKFTDLESVVTHKMSFNLVPFDVVTDFVKVTSDTALVPITVQVKNKVLTFNHKEGVATAVVNIYGRISTLTGRVAQTFEDTLKVSTTEELLPREVERPSVYWKAVPLRSGRYRVDIVVKDVNGDRVGSWSRGIMVPEFGDERLMASSLILADVLEKVPTRTVGAGNFVIGDTKVRPRVPEPGKPATFNRNQAVNFWMQVYNLGIDEQTHKPSATVEVEITNLANQKAVLRTVETTQQLGNVGDQLTLAKSVPAGNLLPGQYRVTVKVDDKISKQTVVPTATFTVE
ncbi:MAG TPA: GWxTD domain-containing protein [Terriglobales bacterium]|nr:GWxTD domain-containing protein [Terriglobales bacterium]